MDTNEKTPLWLDLRKEYIDDNFEKLLCYLKDCSLKKSQDAFYSTTINLLRERVGDLLSTLAVRPIYADEEDRRQLTFNAKLLASYLLVDGSYTLALPAYIVFLGQLRILNPRMSDSILKAMMDRLRYETIETLGFGWSDLEDIGTELFAYRVSTTVKFADPVTKPLVFTKHGTAILSDKGLSLTCLSKADSQKLYKTGAHSVESRLGIALLTPPSEKLKQSSGNDLVAMDEFTNTFILQQSRVQEKKKVQFQKSYEEGEEAIVQIKAIDSDGTIHVETVDTNYKPIAGVIKYEKASLVYYKTNTLYQCFHVGDYLTATLKNLGKGFFSIDKQLIDFFVEDTRNYAAEDNMFLSKLIDERPTSYGWINSFGIAFYTSNTGQYSRGEFAVLSVKSYGKGDYYGKIDATIEERSEEDFDEQIVRHDCIRAFAERTQPPAAPKTEEEMGELSPAIIRLLLRQIFDYQKTLLKPSERFRVLSNANVMAELVDDELSASYIRFARTYLRALVQFVHEENFDAVQLIPDQEYKDATSTLIRMTVIDLLKEYGKKENSEKLAQAIADYKDTQPVLSRLARLIQTSNSMRGTLSDAALNVIRREIIKTLSFETENDADLEEDGCIYLGVESGTQEFKTSMVYPAGNQMQPEEFTQNQNVLKGVCAFLNSTTGGTLYLGVNDQGAIIGIEADMKYLKISSIDSYMRYVQDTAKREFGIDTLPYLHIEPMYEDTVVAIHVEPHPYRVVELNGTAYLRVNAESRQMPEQMRQELIARKVFVNKDKAAAISRLQHAWSQKKCVILHDYASSHGGNVSDRKVEAYDVRPEDGLIVCYDTNRQQVRVFNINRIGYVEILENEPWKHTASHKKVNVDVFHMTGDTTYHVSLQLDLMAKNLLSEEFPSAKPYIAPHKGDDNIWYFDTDVVQLEGIGRFYIGLANHIKILDAPELETYVKEYTQKYL